jgi:RNA polymerase sigma-70 factor (ECF subfamily)
MREETHAPPADYEVEIMQAARIDPDRFAPIYERYFPRIYMYCLRGVDHPAEAEDLASQIFTQALTGLPNYQGGSVGAWLFRIAHNALANYYRSRRPLLSLDAMETDITDTHPEPGQFVAEAEEWHQLNQIVSALPDDQRHLLALKIGGGLSSQEIGALLGKSAGAVRVELHRIIKRLRAEYKKENHR